MRLSASFYDGDDDKQVNDITESLGFREVVVNSGFLTDCRNPILMLGTDGANPFARERVSTYQLWPMICALANIPRLRRYKSHIVWFGVWSCLRERGEEKSICQESSCLHPAHYESSVGT